MLMLGAVTLLLGGRGASVSLSCQVLEAGRKTDNGSNSSGNHTR